jgi:hypothetical protein
MANDGADGIAILLAALAVPVMLFGGRLFRSARSRAGRAVAVATILFGVTLLALIVPVLAAQLLSAAGRAVWEWLQSS